MSRSVMALEMKPAGGPLKVGAAVQLNLFGLNAGGGTDLIMANLATWTSSHPALAEVNRQGRLTPRRAGEVTITAAHSGKNVAAVFVVGD